jgi:hypothetical protein
MTIIVPSIATPANVGIIIQDAMFAARVLGADNTPQAGDVQLCLRAFSRMLGTWANDRLMVYSMSTETFTMSAGVGQYSTNLLAAGRPVAIQSMYVSLSNVDYPVTMIDQQRWNAISVKNISSIPSQCFYDTTMDEGTMNFYPEPSGVFTCTVNAQRAIVGDITTASYIDLPLGYEAALVASLAVEIWPYFKPGEVPKALMQARTEAKSALQRVNYQALEMALPFRSSDISNGFPYRTF